MLTPRRATSVFGRRRGGEGFVVAGVVVGENPVATVGGDGEADQTAGAHIAMPAACRRRHFGFGLGFQNRQRNAAIAQQIVGNDRLCLVVHRRRRSG